jgi:single-stranded DNA-specific DHH superfamily exonuclease
MKIGGMLDRDHALTELGISQARGLNHRWKEYLECRLQEHREVIEEEMEEAEAEAEAESPKNAPIGSK